MKGTWFYGKDVNYLETSFSVRREKLAKDDMSAGSGNGFDPVSASSIVIRDVLIVATLLVKKVVKS